MLPDKPGHTGVWPAYSLAAGGVRIDAIYTANTLTVTFDPNGGTGEMESVTTAWGSTITLPQCGFTAPNGKVFDKWDAGNPGDEIEVKSDLTVKAIWKSAVLRLTESKRGTTGEVVAVTVPYARKGAAAFTLTASEENVTFTSSKPDLLSVDENGVVRLERFCIFCRYANITATAEDGREAVCQVKIDIAWWQYLVWLLLGSFWF